MLFHFMFVCAVLCIEKCLGSIKLNIYVWLVFECRYVLCVLGRIPFINWHEKKGDETNEEKGRGRGKGERERHTKTYEYMYHNIP